VPLLRTLPLELRLNPLRRLVGAACLLGRWRLMDLFVVEGVQNGGDGRSPKWG
jgi:hypothetical protein